MSRTVLRKELCRAGGCLSDLVSFYFSPGHSILITQLPAVPTNANAPVSLVLIIPTA